MAEPAAGPVKRSVTIRGHRTSLSLEPAFWAGLACLADRRGVSLAGLVAAVDERRGRTNLSSALRVEILAAAKAGEL